MVKSRREYIPPQRKLRESEAILKGMGLDLAEIVRELGVGSITVRAFVTPKGELTYTARVHSDMGKSLEAPREYLSVREVVDGGRP